MVASAEHAILLPVDDPLLLLDGAVAALRNLVRDQLHHAVTVNVLDGDLRVVVVRLPGLDAAVFAHRPFQQGLELALIDAEDGDADPNIGGRLHRAAISRRYPELSAQCIVAAAERN